MCFYLCVALEPHDVTWALQLLRVLYCSFYSCFFMYVAQVVAILYVFLPCVIANVRHFVTVVCEQHYKSSLICICTAVIFIVVLGLKQ